MAGAAENMILSDRAVALAHAIEAAYPFEAQRNAAGFPDLARWVTDVWAAAGPGEDSARTLRDISRFSAAMLISHLEATPGGLSLARLRAVVERPGLGGVGHGRAVMTYLRYAGYIEPLPKSGDGRVQLYRVTDRIRAKLRIRMRRELEARTGVDPAIPALLARIDDEAAFDALLVAMSETALAIFRDSVQRTNPVDLFSHRQNGMLLLCELAKQGGEGDVFPPRGPLDYKVADLARRTGSSRMQVDHLLRKARNEGFLITDADGRLRFSEALADGLERVVASTTLLIVGAARMVLDG